MSLTLKYNKSYRVFNADQVENYEPTTGLESGDLGAVEKIEFIEQFINGTGAVVNEDKGKACFNLVSHEISMHEQRYIF